MRLGKPAEGSGTWLEGTPTPGCMGGYFPERPGPHFVFEHDHLARISIRGVRDIQTARGIHLGSTEDEVRAAYGAALVVSSSESIPPPAKTMTVWFHHHTQGIRFDTDISGRVVSMIAGTPSIMRGANCPLSIPLEEYMSEKSATTTTRVSRKVLRALSAVALVALRERQPRGLRKGVGKATAQQADRKRSIRPS